VERDKILNYIKPDYARVSERKLKDSCSAAFSYFNEMMSLSSLITFEKN